ncbi:TPA: hypothetical protein DCR49_04295 [Candidatus Delongbacteria bacterium]|uniref:Uncharacterized protein n=1 Tax=Candidatus Uhrbacteria bacterium GW2011_GWF2_39_13 TaxID=1618995 RepID=A0A0G0QPB8_9BACT|nr:MAG: hypothetical protein UT30_C0028G0004 [Candidatus Uhrbacteria bacterium GW2011_GWF2_39_13]HAQ61206.1 hypothetical protein [Candidatus Delongbacteria bacterium]
MKRIVVLIIILSTLVFSSTFDLKYGGNAVEHGFDVQRTTDSGFILAGGTNSSGSGLYDGYLIKTDSTGTVEWEEVIGSASNEYFIKVRQTSDEGIIALGIKNIIYNYPYLTCDPWLAKYDKNGKFKWEKIFTEADVFHIVNDFIIAEDEGFLLLGSKKTSTGTYDAWLMKADSSGSLIWEQVYDGGNYDEGRSIINDFSGGYLLTCNSTRYFSIALKDQVWGIFVDQNGNVITQNIINNSSDDKYCQSVCATSDSCYVITGNINPEMLPPSYIGEYNQGLYLLKLNSLFSTEWIQYYNSDQVRSGKSCIEVNDGGFTILGTASAGSDPENIWLVKTDSSGDLIWERYYGSYLDDTGSGNIIQLADNSLVLCGTADIASDSSSSQINLIKTDSNGYVIYPPVITSFGNDSNNVSINWEAVSNAGSYIVYGSDRPDSNFTAIDTTAVNLWNTSVTDSLKKKFYYIKASTNNFSK